MSDCLSPSRIDDYVRGASSASERQSLESHVETCAACLDALVEREIEALLHPDGPPAPDPRLPRPHETRIGPYRLIEELGRGGQARVYLAEDTRLSRRVALKVLPPEFAATDSMLSRFRREAYALSRLDHPGIASVYESGHWDGCPYIAMRYVEGGTLAQRIAKMTAERAADEGPSTDDAMALVAFIERAARALHAAHEAGLVHRDIKPSNIMISTNGEPVIVDFGLANDRAHADQRLTRSGDIAGTPAYMSPEQILGQRGMVDRQSDVYSLGVTLHEALTLKLPFDAPTTAGMFQRSLSGERTVPSGMGRRMPRDLEVILDTALERDRGRRYQTALAFAEDLRRYRAHETILASPAGPGLRLRRWTQRNPAIAVALIAAFAILATALVLSLALLDRIRRESEVRAEGLLREEGLRLALQSSAVLEESPGQALLLAIEAARRAPSFAANNALMKALASCHERARLAGHSASVNDASYSPDGTRVATASDDGTARIWDAGSGELVAVVRSHEAAVVTAEFGPDGTRVLTASLDGTARISNASNGAEEVRLGGHASGLVLARFSPDGTRVLTVAGAAARLWDAATGVELREFDGHDQPIRCARFSPDGARVLTGAADGTALIRDAASGRTQLRLTAHEGEVLDARWSETGREVITSSGGSFPAAIDGVARIWDAESGELVASLRGHTYGIYAAAILGEGRLAVTGGEDFTARIWDTRTAKELHVLRHAHKVVDVDVSRDCLRLLTASYDRSARVWDLASGKLLAEFKGHEAPLRQAAFSPDGRSAVTASVDVVPRLWSFPSPWPIDALSARQGVVTIAAMDSPGRLVAVVDASGTAVELIRCPSGASVRVLAHHRAPITIVELAPDGRNLLTVSDESVARLWDVETGDLLREFAGHTAPILDASFSSDGRIIATASEDGTVRVRDAVGGQDLSTIRGPDAAFSISSPSPDGRRVVCGARNGFLGAADGASGRVLVSLTEPGVRPTSAEWSPDGRRIVVAAKSSRVRVRDAATGEVLGTLIHASRASFAAYSPDGAWIATECEDRMLRIWDAGTLEEALDLEREGFAVSTNVGFTAEGRQIVVLGWDTNVRHTERSRLLIFPLSPLEEAVKWHRGSLSADERDRFSVGSTEERAARRAAAAGRVDGSAVGPEQWKRSVVD